MGYRKPRHNNRGFHINLMLQPLHLSCNPDHLPTDQSHLREIPRGRLWWRKSFYYIARAVLSGKAKGSCNGHIPLNQPHDWHIGRVVLKGHRGLNGIKLVGLLDKTEAKSEWHFGIV